MTDEEAAVSMIKEEIDQVIEEYSEDGAYDGV